MPSSKLETTSTKNNFELATRLQNDDESVLAEILNTVVPNVWKFVIPPVGFGKTLVVQKSLSETLPENASTEIVEEIIAKTLARLWHLRKQLDFEKYDLFFHVYRILRSEIRELKPL